MKISPLFVAVGLTALQAAVVTIPVTEDTGLHQNFPNNNLGRVVILPIGTSSRELAGGELAKARSLIRFDLAGKVPAGVTVTRARVMLTTVGGPGAPSSPFALSKMLVGWTEGAGGGGDDIDGRAALAGETTWNQRVALDAAWGTSGARGAADVAPAASATVDINSLGAFTFDSAQLAADVQSWVNNPASNFGWVIWGVNQTGRGIAWQIAAREWGETIPQLEVTYSEPAAELRITGITVANGQVDLTWTGGRPPYRIERRAEITGTPEILPTEIATTSASVPVSGARSFYRVVGSN